MGDYIRQPDARNWYWRLSWLYPSGNCSPFLFQKKGAGYVFLCGMSWWVKWGETDTQWLGGSQYFLRRIAVLPCKYCSTSFAVLQYFHGSTGKRSCFFLAGWPFFSHFIGRVCLFVVFYILSGKYSISCPVCFLLFCIRNHYCPLKIANSSLK